MDNVINLLDKVALVADVENLRKGMVGTVVEVYADGEAFEVEFMNAEGRTYAVETIAAENLLKLLYAPVAVE
jgi:hypothetical protein